MTNRSDPCRLTDVPRLPLARSTSSHHQLLSSSLTPSRKYRLLHQLIFVLSVGLSRLRRSESAVHVCRTRLFPTPSVCSFLLPVC